MAKREIQQGATNQSIDVFIQDSSSAIGAGLTGLVFNSAGLACHFREGATATATALTLATQTVGGVHSDGGFVEISSANMPGQYRLDLSDTIVSGPNPFVNLMLKGATNMAPVLVELQLVGYDPFSALATEAKQDTAQTDLDTITGADGVTLATAQGLYAPNKVVPDAAGVAPTVTEITADIDSNSTQLAKLGTPAGVSMSADILAIDTDTGNILTNIAALNDFDPTTDTVDVGALGGNTAALLNLLDSCLTIKRGTVTGTPTTTTTEATGITVLDDDHFIGRIIIWLDSDLALQGTAITDYDKTTQIFTHNTLTRAATVGSKFVIL